MVGVLMIGSLAAAPEADAGTVCSAHCTSTSTTTISSPVALARKPFTPDFGTAQVLTIGSNTASIATCPTGVAGVTIDWGDGTTSAPEPATPITSGPKTDATPVTGRHTYTQAGSYTVPNPTSSDSGCSVGQISISDISVGMTVIATNVNTNRNTIHVSVVDCGTLAVTGSPISAQPGTPFSGVVATFAPQQSNAVGCPADGQPFTAQINWGDGQTSAGSVKPAGGGSYSISGTHTYASAGSFTVGTSASGDDGTQGNGQSTATVAAPGGGGGGGPSSGGGSTGGGGSTSTPAPSSKSKKCKRKKKKHHGHHRPKKCSKH